MRQLTNLCGVLRRWTNWRVPVCTAAAVLCLAAVISAQESASAPAGGDSTSKPSGEEPSTVKMIQPGAFDIHARDTDLRLVLQLLSTQGRKNIVATKEVSGKVSADLYGVTFKEALDAVLRATGYVYEEKGNFVYVYTPEQLEKVKKAERKMAVKTFRLTYINANDAKTLVTPHLSAEGTVALTPAALGGITPSKTDTGGASYAADDVLVIRDYEDKMPQIEAFIREIDVKPQQVLIEATILQATLDESNALGVDFNVLAGVDFQNIDSSSNGVEDLTKGKLDAKTIGANTDMAAWRTDFAGLVPKGGFSFGFISDNFAAFVRALESVTPTTVLANPKLLIVNRQRGEVLIGRHDGYLTTTVTETVATQTVQFLDTGTRLIVRPYIGKSGDVRMEIHPEDSSGGIVQFGQNALPQSSTTEVTSNVIVKDGRTIVIGGLFREETKAGRSQVPVLGNVPVLGTLFKGTTDSTKRTEIIILITPHIIRAEDTATAEMVKDNVERWRVGARKDLECWGHDRLSELFMRKARHELNEGDISKALWNSDVALSMSPQMPEAITLNEQVTRKAYWHNEVRRSDAQWIIQQMMMEEIGKPFEEGVPPIKPLNVNKLPTDVRDVLDLKQRAVMPLPLLIDTDGRPVIKSPATQPTDGGSDKPSAEGSTVE
ncbi:MAG: secretin and TonB N-terminal domain-containing protein [Phycisphaerae bacterium]